MTTFSLGHLDREIKWLLTGCHIDKIGRHNADFTA